MIPIHLSAIFYRMVLFGLLTIPIGISTEVPAQFFHDYIELAESFMEAGDFQKAADYYSKAFSRRIPERNKYYYSAARAHALLGDRDSAFFFLEKAISLRWYDHDSLSRDPAFITLHETAEWKESLHLLQETKQRFEKGILRDLQEELLQIKAGDQWIRKFYGENIDPIFGKETTEYKQFWKMAGYLDSLKTDRLDTLVAIHGWPDISLVGEEANKGAWLVAMHSGLEKQEKYLPLLETSCKNGESYWSYYAHLHDRIMAKKEKTTVYGCSFYYDEEKEMYIGTVKDRTKVNLLREKMGLAPAEAYRAHDEFE